MTLIDDVLKAKVIKELEDRKFKKVDSNEYIQEGDFGEIRVLIDDESILFQYPQYDGSERLIFDDYVFSSDDFDAAMATAQEAIWNEPEEINEQKIIRKEIRKSLKEARLTLNMQRVNCDDS